MKITFNIPDDLYDKFVAQAGDPKAVNGMLRDRLDRFQDCTATVLRPLELTDEQRITLSTLLDKPVTTGGEVVAAFEDILRFDVGEFVYTFKPEDLDILARQAEYWDKPLDEFIVDMMDEFTRFATNQN